MRGRVAVQVAEDIDKRRVAPGVGGRRGVRALVRRATLATLRHTADAAADISVTLLDDAAIAVLHLRYLGRPGPTDVLAFALHDDGDPAHGDVYIGLEQARRQADRLGVGLGEEIARLAVHGTLHVLGWEHPEGSGRERSPMWQLQEAILLEVSDV